MVRFEDLRIFVSAADHGSFSAARELDLTPAVASAALKRLELTLETRLFVRSTRSLRLTADGERYLEYARSAIATLDAGRNALARDKTAISGTLSISVPSDLGRNVLLPWLDEFQRRHPRVGFQVRISDRLADLFRQPVDLAVRYGTPADSSLVALPLSESNRRVVCASPAYLARHGTPQAPADLRRHNCLSFVLGESLHDRWTFERDGVSQTVPVRATASATTANWCAAGRWPVAAWPINRATTCWKTCAPGGWCSCSATIWASLRRFTCCACTACCCRRRSSACAPAYRSASPRSRQAERGPPDGAHQARGAPDGALPGIRLQAAAWRAGGWRRGCARPSGSGAPAGRAFGSGGFARGGGTVGGAALAGGRAGLARERLGRCGAGVFFLQRAGGARPAARFRLAVASGLQVLFGLALDCRAGMLGRGQLDAGAARL